MRPTKVYIAQEGPFDYVSAEGYGDLEFCSVNEITAHSGGRLNDNIISGIRLSMADYIPGHDYILLSGSPVAIAHCLSVAFNKSNKVKGHQLLKWDAQRGTYLKYIVDG
jgi:hypothetical protein